MVFLMNDVVLTLDSSSIALPLDAHRFRSLTMPYVIQLGQELFAESPRLQHTDPEKAARLALLIASKAPEVNAVLFVAPSQGCNPAEVMVRYCEISFDIMAQLQTHQSQGVLNTVTTDTQVWRRLAA